ncbi:MAG: sensor histidine kinase, partial [Lachnospiraceae bacterium]|nr:sensor histidine kinase [Lachnospiraceae bacterium]
DNGSGIPRDELNRLRDNLRSEASFTELGVREKQSIGLKNIQSRIELYYGKGYGLTIYSEEGKGTDIDIKIPVLKKEMI